MHSTPNTENSKELVPQNEWFITKTSQNDSYTNVAKSLPDEKERKKIENSRGKIFQIEISQKVQDIHHWRTGCKFWAHMNS